MLRLFACRLFFGLALSLFTPLSFAATAYLPLHLAPEVESRVERLLVLANMPVIKRPIAVEHIEKAVAKVQAQDPVLAAYVAKYLQRYQHKASLTHLNIAPALYKSDETYPLPNQRGFDSQSDILLSASGFADFGWGVANLGAAVGEREGELITDNFDGSFLSFGGGYLQLDVGYRAHWFGPFQDSDMLTTTNSESMASITASNVKPFSFLNMHYEVFWAQMSESDSIRSYEDPSVRLTGKPQLFGLHLSFEPLPGFAIGFNRLMQYGGADREDGFLNLLEAFFFPENADNIDVEGRDFGNQLTSITTRYTFAGGFPMSVYMEYAGEDTSATSRLHLGNSSLMAGIHLPVIFKTLDFTYEWAEWQNGWYVNSNYGDGLTHYGRIVGHWGGDQRRANHAVGAQAQTAKLIWMPSATHTISTYYRTVKNDFLSADEYSRGEELQLEYAFAWKAWYAGITLMAGQTVFDEDFGRAAVFLRW